MNNAVVESVVLGILTAISLWNLYEETEVRVLHRWGRSVTGEILRIKRYLPKDRDRQMFGGSDPMDSYETKCDYILSVRYHDGDRGRIRKDLIVPDFIAINCGISDPKYKEGAQVQVKALRALPGRIVVDSPAVRKRQTGILAYCCWIIAATVCLGMLLA